MRYFKNAIVKLIGHLHNPIAWMERHFCGKVSAWFISDVSLLQYLP